MRRALAITVLSCVLGAGVVAIALDLAGALLTFELLLAVSVAALAAGLLAQRSRKRIGSLSRQLALAGSIAVGAILAAVWVAAAVMFISSEDALLVSVMAAVIAAVGVCVARLLTEPMVHDIERLRDRLRAVGVGERRTDLVLGGNDELSDLAAATNAMIEQLASEETARAAADDARRRLIVAVSHDLRTPIASLRVLTEAVQDQIVSGATRTRYLGEMQTHVAILSGLINDLFELSRAQTGDINLKSAQIEIGELVSETVAAMTATGEDRGVTLCAEPPAGRDPGVTLAVHADPDQMRRVMLNVLDNAVRHTPRGGAVTVRTQRSGTKVEVEVADNGTGIPTEDCEHVFEAFYRGGEHTSRSDGGSGLGLAIARAIIEAHGGEIWLAPAQVGTRVCFTLPAIPRHRAHPSPPRVSITEPAPRRAVLEPNRRA